MKYRTNKEARIAATNHDYAGALNWKLFPLVGYILSTAEALTYRDAGYSVDEAVEAIDGTLSDSRGWDC